jgi:membrane-bound metal-dependent hydrolase YbcI (DUF457 family)
MKLPEHLALSFVLGHFGVQPEYGIGGTLLVVAAGLLPDLDGITILGGWRCHRTYHRVVGHGILTTLFGPLALAVLGSSGLELGPLLPLWFWLQLALLLHLLTDVLFYRWPATLFWPFSRHGLGLGWIDWNDLVPTVLLYGAAGLTLAGADAALALAPLGLLVLYLLWRAWQPRPRSGWAGWLTGNWARNAIPVWRWLTGDFVRCENFLAAVHGA